MQADRARDPDRGDADDVPLTWAGRPRPAHGIGSGGNHTRSCTRPAQPTRVPGRIEIDHFGLGALAMSVLLLVTPLLLGLGLAASFLLVWRLRAKRCEDSDNAAARRLSE